MQNIEKWQPLQYLLTRGSPLCHPDFEASSQVRKKAIEDREVQSSCFIIPLFTLEDLT